MYEQWEDLSHWDTLLVRSIDFSILRYEQLFYVSFYTSETLSAQV